MVWTRHARLGWHGIPVRSPARVEIQGIAQMEAPPDPVARLLARRDAAPSDAELAQAASEMSVSGEAAAAGYLAVRAAEPWFTSRLLELLVGALTVAEYAKFYRRLRDDGGSAGTPIDERELMSHQGPHGLLLRRVRLLAVRRFWEADLDDLLDVHETESDILCEVALEASAAPAANVRALCRAHVTDPRVVRTVIYSMDGYCGQYRYIARLLTLRDRGCMTDDEVDLCDREYMLVLEERCAARFDWYRDHAAYHAWLRSRGRAETSEASETS